MQPAQNSLRVTGQGSVLGTRGYMSPEQARGDIEVDHRTDIFSLGAILTFMLTGSAPGELPAASGRPNLFYSTLRWQTGRFIKEAGDRSTQSPCLDQRITDLPTRLQPTKG